MNNYATSSPTEALPVVLSGVEKTFGSGRGKAVALRNVSMQLERGRVYGLIGRNGSGKTTLLRTIAGQLLAQGSVQVGGQEVFDNPVVLQHIIYAGMDADFPEGVPLQSLIDTAAARWPYFDREFALHLVERFGLDLRKSLAASSRGQRSLAAVVLGIAARCPVTLLDEPYLGVDVQNRDELYRLLLDDLAAFPRTVVISTHHIDDAAKVLDAVIFIEGGTVTAVRDLDDVLEHVVQISGAESAVADVLRRVSAEVAFEVLRDQVLAGSRKVILSQEWTTGGLPSGDLSAGDLPVGDLRGSELKEAVRAAVLAGNSGVQVQNLDLESAVIALSAGRGAAAE